MKFVPGAVCSRPTTGVKGPPPDEMVYIADMGVKKFEEIKAWQEARKLTAMVYMLTKQGHFRSDFS